MKHGKKNTRRYIVAASVGALLSAGVATGAYAGTTGESSAPASAPVSAPAYQPEMLKALATTLGVSEKAAAERLDREADQRDRFAELRKDRVETLGAFFAQDGSLVVNAADAEAAEDVRAAGLRARVPERGEGELDRIKAQLDAKALKSAPAGVSAWSVDLASDTVTVEVNGASDAATRSFLTTARSNGDAVRVVKGQEKLETQAVVPPGSRMTFNGYLCSVGYGAKDRNGKQVLVTAGHCIEDLPALAYNGTRFAKGTHTRFALGTRSVDMGIASVDAGNSIGLDITTYGKAGTVPVKGSKRAPSGAALCKSGQTTGWTCGKVGSYNVSVTYTDQNGGPDTVVTGLASSSVCTQGGDSGGAYVSGDQAQGMTSGGPTNQRCSGQVNSPGSSYFQPLDDALAYYGLTLNTK
ncbi:MULTISPECIES: S1 family peptidase [Streptomyces]|uniref:S1 family peptidase n=1 Tax=Streptomyces globisporus TaxID=1908 RepID=A0A927BJ13_STRGL|nr:MULTISPECIES: S1 family peptidase [Streptomyces]MBD2827888.1 S1 family peptidase [Streptomyces globisporus]MYW79456.1 S1 family peptidase [Streptomyces sp. SID8369]NEA13903.1 S1 family peptidase [Streptomyces sp. SID10692]NEC41492.1 S1 family peptidase [Streptomyces sp. SID8016]MBD3546472.1 S1 family peptidase [Streptomyces sp. JV180]